MRRAPESGGNQTDTRLSRRGGTALSGETVHGHKFAFVLPF